MASVGLCAIPGYYRNLPKVWNLGCVRDFSKGFNITAIEPISAMTSVTSDDISKIIPAHALVANAQGDVAGQIIDHSVSNFFNSDRVRNSPVGRTAHQIEKSMEGDLSFGGSQPASVKHSLKFAMRATQTRAQVEYSGYTTAQVTYSIVHEEMNVEVREPVKALNTQLVFNHIASKTDRTQIMSFRWAW